MVEFLWITGIVIVVLLAACFGALDKRLSSNAAEITKGQLWRLKMASHRNRNRNIAKKFLKRQNLRNPLQRAAMLICTLLVSSVLIACVGVIRNEYEYYELVSGNRSDFTAYNTLCVAACALLHGIAPYVICNALSGEMGVDGRMEKIKINENADISVFIDYAHTPDALEKLLRSVNRFKGEGQRTVLLFGCGGNRDKTKRPAMGRIASELADLVIVTSDNSRGESADAIISDIVGGFSENGCPYEIIIDRREAIEFAIKNARHSDVILLAGKGHEKYEIDSTGKKDFDEKKIVVELIEKYYSNESK